MKRGRREQGKRGKRGGGWNANRNLFDLVLHEDLDPER